MNHQMKNAQKVNLIKTNVASDGMNTQCDFKSNGHSDTEYIIIADKPHKNKEKLRVS